MLASKRLELACTCSSVLRMRLHKIMHDSCPAHARRCWCTWACRQACCCWGASAIRERAGLLENGLSLVAAKPAHYAVAVLMGFLVNLSTAFAIKVTGSLTFKVRHGLCCHCYSLCLPYSLWEGVVMLQFCMLTYYDGLSVPALSAEGSAQKMLCLYSWGAGVGGARRMLHETMLKSHAGGGLREEHAAGVGGLWLMGDVVTAEQLAGYTISVLGFALYTRVKMRGGLLRRALPRSWLEAWQNPGNRRLLCFVHIEMRRVSAANIAS